MRRNPVGIFGIHAGEDVNNYRCSHPLPAEAAIPAVLSPPIAHSHATFQGHTGRIKSAVLARTADECSLPVGTVPRGSGRLRAASSWPLSKATPAELVARSLAQTAGGSTASHDHSARLWFLLPAGVPPPEWCADFLVWLGGKRINRDGQIETLSGDESLKVKPSFVRT